MRPKLIDTVASQRNVNEGDTARRVNEEAGCGIITKQTQRGDILTRRAMSSCVGEMMKQVD